MNGTNSYVMIAVRGMKLSSNGELYKYRPLRDAQLKNRGSEVLNKDVAKALRTASAFPATEFLGESRIALRRVPGKKMAS